MSEYPNTPVNSPAETMYEKTKMVSLSELELHKTQKDLWISIGGNVYDVSNFVDLHPGKVTPLLFYAGKDGSEGFNKVHPNVDPSKIPQVVLVGKLSI